MAAGTPVDLDSYWLSQSTVFTDRVKVEMQKLIENINSELPTGVTGTMPNSVHAARKQFAANMDNPNTFTQFLPQFTLAAASDQSAGGVIDQATQSATNYTPITSAALGDAASPNVSDAAIANALSAALPSFIQGI